MVMQRLMWLAAIVFALAALPACSSGSLLNATPVPIAFTISGAGPQVGKTAQLNGIAQMSDGSSKNVTSQVTDWASSDTTVATVATTGLVTGVKSGSVTITASYQGLSSPALALTVP
jgi:hypothetical protein